MNDSSEITAPLSDENWVALFTDGACSGNPGPGGWGVLLRYGIHEKTLSGGDPETTNNRMEMLAVINGLNALKGPARVRIYTDSQYVMKGMTEWLAGWKRRGWKTAGRQPVKNVDLWQHMEAALVPHHVEWYWVRGHSGHPENERVDQLARAAIGVRSALWNRRFEPPRRSAPPLLVQGGEIPQLQPDCYIAAPIKNRTCISDQLLFYPNGSDSF